MINLRAALLPVVCFCLSTPSFASGERSLDCENSLGVQVEVPLSAAEYASLVNAGQTIETENYLVTKDAGTQRIHFTDKHDLDPAGAVYNCSTN